jgi:hypothetical protein
LKTLEKHFLPLFDPSSSVAIVVTAPSKAEEIDMGLQSLGFEVEQRELAVDPEEPEWTASDGESESGSESIRSQ